LESIVFLCQKAKVVSFRDNYTKNFLVQKGLAGKEIDVIGDPAVLLNEEKDKKIKISKDKINIGLNLNYSGWLGFGWWQNKIIQSYNVIIKYYQKNNADIYYMVHHPGEYKILNNLNNVKIIDVYPKKQKYIYSKMDIIIGMMLHSCVMSFGALTPEINLAYDIRNFNFANFIKCPELAIAPNELSKNKLLSLSKNVLKKNEEYKKIFKTKKEDIKKRHQKFIKKIENILKNEVL